MSFVYFLEYTFISNTFINNAMLKLGNAKQHPEAELLLFENFFTFFTRVVI